MRIYACPFLPLDWTPPIRPLTISLCKIIDNVVVFHFLLAIGHPLVRLPQRRQTAIPEKNQDPVPVTVLEISKAPQARRLQHKATLDILYVKPT